MATVRAKLGTWVERAFFAMSRRHACHDVDVRCWLPNPEDEAALGRICEALGLIARHAPVRLARLRKDLRGIWVTYAAGNVAEYHADVGLCVLDRTHLAREGSAARIAATIVHEATHARLWRRGVGYEAERRARVEDVCFRAEIAFASRLPDGQPIIEEARRQRERDPEVWTREASRARAIAKLDEIGVPRWLARLIVRIGRSKSAG